MNELILGLNIFGHDTSCTLFDTTSGQILFALTEERFSNKKHDSGFPVASLRILIDKIETENLGSISYIALNIDPEIFVQRLRIELFDSLDVLTADFVMHELEKFLPVTDILHSEHYPLNYLENSLARQGVVPSVVAKVSGKISWYGNLTVRHRKLREYLQYKFPGANIASVNHHLCHAASAFYCSSFEVAAVLTIDGQGEDATITLNKARNGEITVLTQSVWPNSLGALYMQIAWYLGFDGDVRYPGFGDEYKVMGMAAYGKPVFVEIFREFGYVNDEGKFQLRFGRYLDLVPVEGCPGHFQPLLSDQFFVEVGNRRSSLDPIIQHHYDIAKSGQIFLEEIGVSIAKHLKILCPDTDNLCISGGVALNGLMNLKIFREAGFARVFIQPASGDDGTSLGAALHVHHHLLKRKRCKPLFNAYLGLNYGDQVIRAALEKYKLEFYEPEAIHTRIGQLLFEGKIIARYVGRGEFGPRALGNRSILVSPMEPEFKDAVNAKIKQRESFRPFAPACLEDRACEFFDIDVSTPYMLLVCNARPDKAQLIPAVVHYDGSARLQTVNAEQNPDLYQIIFEFNKHSKVPVLLNTSFNVNGESIVETPQDAIESFLFMGIDFLAIGPYLVSKENNPYSLRSLDRENFIKIRKDRYTEQYFSHELFLWSIGNPIETDLVLSHKQVEIYKTAAESRLAVIEQLDAEVRRLQGFVD